MYSHRPIECIVPPHVLRNITERGTPQQKDWARRTLLQSEQQRGQRLAIAETPALVSLAPATEKSRIVYSAATGTNLPGQVARSEGDPATNDQAVDEAYDGSGDTYDLFKQEFGRISLNDNGMRLDSTVHYGQGYDNAFWNGQQMVYGDGDEDLPEGERLFNRFTASLDVVGHELTHGVVQFTGGLVYRDQSGALNEHFADVFGSLVKQRKLNQSAQDADWLIGAELLTQNVSGQALRSLRDPGTAYDDPVLGKDPQPGHMDHYKDVDYDNGGVHINSGIPNHAFYVTATSLDGPAWERAGKIWYGALTDSRLGSRATFQELANLTFAITGQLYGFSSPERTAVESGWGAVGIGVNGSSEGEEPGNEGEKDEEKKKKPNGCLTAIATLGIWR